MEGFVLGFSSAYVEPRGVRRRSWHMHLTRVSTFNLNFLPLDRVSIAHGVWASAFTFVHLEIAIDNERGPAQPHFAKNACFYQDPIGPWCGWRTIAQQWAAKA